MNSELPSLSQKLSEQRIEQAEILLGNKIIRKILAYALFLLGANRSSISSYLEMPSGSIRSLILAINKRGFAGLEDQRTKVSTFKPIIITDKHVLPIHLTIEDSGSVVNFNASPHISQGVSVNGF
jgi:hypothetical protein